MYLPYQRIDFVYRHLGIVILALYDSLVRESSELVFPEDIEISRDAAIIYYLLISLDYYVPLALRYFLSLELLAVDALQTIHTLFQC